MLEPIADEPKDGFTPLHLAAQNGHADIMSLLIEHKASFFKELSDILKSNKSLLEEVEKFNALHFKNEQLRKQYYETKDITNLQEIEDDIGTTSDRLEEIENRRVVEESQPYIPRVLTETKADNNSYTKKGESLSDYCQRLGDEDFWHILLRDGALIGFCHSLLDFKNFAGVNDPCIKNMLSKLEHTDYILPLIREMETVRKNLLQYFDQTEEEIQRIYMFTKFENIFGSVLDIGATVGDFLLQDSYPLYSSVVSSVAVCFGIMKLSNSVSEFASMTNTFQNLKKEFEYDQEVFDHIKKCFTQFEELELAMQAMLPFDFTEFKMKLFYDVICKTTASMDPVRLLAALVESAGEQNIEHLRNENLIQNLINLSSDPAFLEFCNWIHFGLYLKLRHPIKEEFLNFFSRNPLNWPLFENAVMASSALMSFNAVNQNIKPFVVCGRISLNSLNIYRAIMRPRYREVSDVLRIINFFRKHLFTELGELQHFAKCFLLRQLEGRFGTLQKKSVYSTEISCKFQREKTAKQMYGLKP